jgi:hypothetical protein
MRPAMPRLLVLFPLGVMGCSNVGGLAYQPSPTAENSQSVEGERVQGPAALSVGTIDDRRGKGPNELGVVRGGYGNVLKRLTTDEPVADLVRLALEAALQGRGLLADPSQAWIQLRGVVTKLDCNYYVNREAHTLLDIEAIDLASGRFLWKGTYKADLVESAWGAGIFADVDHLRGLAQQSLSQAINDAVQDVQERLLAKEGGDSPLQQVPKTSIDLDSCIQKCREHTDRSKEECFDRCAGLH